MNLIAMNDKDEIYEDPESTEVDESEDTDDTGASVEAAVKQEEEIVTMEAAAVNDGDGDGVNTFAAAVVVKDEAVNAKCVGVEAVKGGIMVKGSTANATAKGRVLMKEEHVEGYKTREVLGAKIPRRSERLKKMPHGLDIKALNFKTREEETHLLPPSPPARLRGGELSEAEVDEVKEEVVAWLLRRGGNPSSPSLPPCQAARGGAELRGGELSEAEADEVKEGGDCRAVEERRNPNRLCFFSCVISCLPSFPARLRGGLSEAEQPQPNSLLLFLPLPPPSARLRGGLSEAEVEEVKEEISGLLLGRGGIPAAGMVAVPWLKGFFSLPGEFNISGTSAYKRGQHQGRQWQRCSCPLQITSLTSVLPRAPSCA
ncbi:unnamed protein product [Closterium sp. Naga37s-1]|nr:unnamed protein product [Closterium sp. Naga37s-1]